MLDTLKTYAVPWSGQLILACRKCQKKLRGDREQEALSKLKKLAKRHNKEHPEQALSILNVGCMDLCPKGGVTVCNAAEVPNRLRILRSEDDLRAVAVAAASSGRAPS